MVVNVKLDKLQDTDDDLHLEMRRKQNVKCFNWGEGGSKVTAARQNTNLEKYSRTEIKNMKAQLQLQQF